MAVTAQTAAAENNADSREIRVFLSSLAPPAAAALRSPPTHSAQPVAAWAVALLRPIKFARVDLQNTLVEE